MKWNEVNPASEKSKFGRRIPRGESEAKREVPSGRDKWLPSVKAETEHGLQSVLVTERVIPLFSFAWRDILFSLQFKGE